LYSYKVERTKLERNERGIASLVQQSNTTQAGQVLLLWFTLPAVLTAIL